MRSAVIECRGQSVGADSITAARARYSALHRISAQIEMSCPTGPFIPEHLKRPPLKAAVLRETSVARLRAADHARGNLRGGSGDGGRRRLSTCRLLARRPALAALWRLFLLGWTFLVHVWVETRVARWDFALGCHGEQAGCR